MPDLTDVRTFLADEHGLAVISTVQRDGRVLSSIANCGVLDHPSTGEPVVAMVSAGGAARLGHIRRGSAVTVAIRRDWRWVAVTGPADIIGPGEVAADGSMDAEGLRLLLRQVFSAAGGTHDDWDEYDRVMAEDRRCCMFVDPARIIGQV